jgi:FkbH-like protein
LISKATSVGLLSDFNIQNLAVILEKQSGGHPVSCVEAPFGQTIGVLLDRTHEFWSLSHDMLVLWTLPERAVPTFGKVLAFDEYSTEDLLGEVDAFAAILEQVPETVTTIVLPTWVASPAERGWGPLAWAHGVGLCNALAQMNLRLAQAVAANRRVVMLDAQRWVTAGGAGAFNPKLWYLSKTPFDSAVFKEAAKDILATRDGIAGRSKKIVILDLDDTLWGGVVGDVGWEKLRLGGHDPVGEAFVDFQKALKRLVSRGVMLALISKNEESVALDSFVRHPEMILKIGDLVGWRINWRDKAQNIVDLLAELNLGPESAVFLDDSAFERGRVRDALPQVFVPELPTDPMQYPSFISQMRCFDSVGISSEDRSRTSMYVADRSRTDLRKEIGSLKDWLGVLDLHVDVEPLTIRNLDRAAQLFNKTNQMNMSTRRLSAAELLSWSEQPEHGLWTFRVWDKFGDYGLCGICSLVLLKDCAQMLDFLLSCRVMGRGVESAMLATVMQAAIEAGRNTLIARYVASGRNEPCRKWLHSMSGADKNSDAVVFSLQEEVAFPEHIQVTFSGVNEKVVV